MTTKQGSTPAKPFSGDEITHAKPGKPAPSQPVKK